MTRNWKQYKVGEIFKRQFDGLAIDDLKTYKRITIKSQGQGVLLRDITDGVSIGTKKQYFVRKGQFVLSKIDAMNGSFGIVPEVCDQGIITGNFWTYEFDESVLNRAYLQYLCLGQVFTEYCRQASSGTTNRKYLDEETFYDLQIPLPPLDIQQRIVEKLDAVREKAEEVRKLRGEQEKDIKNLLYSKYVDVIRNVAWKKMSDVAPIVRRPIEIKPNGEYPEMGIRSFGNGTFHKPSLSGMEVGTKKLFRIKEGDLMFSNVFAWEGAIAVALPEDNDRVGSHRFISCVCDQGQVIPEFLCYHFLTEKGMEDIRLASPGGAGRNKTLGLAKLEKIEVPIPTLLLQEEFVAMQTQLRKLSAEQVQVMDELSALFPALLSKAFERKA